VDESLIIIQFNSLFIYLRSELNKRWPITESSRNIKNKQNETNIIRTRHGKKRGKNDQIMHFKLKFELLKLSTNLQTELEAETHLPVGQWLEEQLNIEKFRMFRVGTRKPTASRTEGQDLLPLKTFIKKRASM
jgi:hypothetical protein